MIDSVYAIAAAKRIAHIRGHLERGFTKRAASAGANSRRPLTFFDLIPNPMGLLLSFWDRPDRLRLQKRPSLAQRKRNGWPYPTQQME
jgi:hypothetical protein